MKYRMLGSTGLEVSRVALGAGPVSQLLTNDTGNAATQEAVLARAFERGVNWIDTAATYGEGRSEENLGRALSALGNPAVHIATKIRIPPDRHDRIAEVARESMAGSLRRLRRERVTLLQIHNSITRRAGDEPTSLEPAQVLAPGGLLEAMQALQRQGLVEHLGLTGLGDPAALAEVIASGAFATVQIPYNLLNPSAGRALPADFAEKDYGNLIGLCQSRGMGVFAIRVLAGGALAGKSPSPHTFKTPFFPLDLYRQDEARAAQLSSLLPPGMSREEAGVRFVAAHSGVTSAIVGFATPEEVDQIVDYAERGPLEESLIERLLSA